MEEIRIIPESIKFIKMTDEEYFSDKYKDYISNSKLSMFNSEEGGSPEKFIQGFENKYSEAYELGSAVHNIILQNNSYYISNLNKPSGKLGVFVDNVLSFRKQGYTIKESILLSSEKSDYYKGSLSDTRFKTAFKKGIEYYLNRIKQIEKIEDKIPIYLSSSIKEKVNNCLNGIATNKNILNTLFPKGLLEDPEIFNEYAILCEVEVTIDGITTTVKIKGKLDNVVIDHENNEIILNDLKTTGKPVNFFMGNFVKVMSEDGIESEIWMEGSFQKYRYYRQMGLYLWLINSVMLQEYGVIYKLKANMVVVETIPNFRSKVYRVTSKQINFGLKEFKRILIDIIKWKNH